MTKVINDNKGEVFQITDPYQFLEEFQDSKDVKTVENTKTIVPNIILYDVFLEHQGLQEDEVCQFFINNKLLAENEKLRVNIRTGNSIIQLLSSNGEVQKTIWIRQGVLKFFELQREYIELNLKMRTQLSGINRHSEIFHEQVHALQFKNTYKALNQGNQIRVLFSQLHDGEDAQITWSSDTKSWLIASKYVSILAQKREDLKIYHDDGRFQLTSAIAEAWFDQLQKLQQKADGSHRIGNLKNDLTGRTLIGHLVGHPKYQNVVRYNSVGLRFSNIMNVNVPASLEQVVEFLDHYEFNPLAVYDIGVHNNFIQLNETLLQKLDQIAQSDIEQQGKGAVLYFRKESQDNQKEIISVMSVHTLEYRIFDELYKSLSYFIENTSTIRKDVLGQLKKDIKKMYQAKRSARKLEFYNKLAELSFNFAEDYQSRSYDAIDQFPNFISILYDCKEKKTEVLPSMFDESNLIKINQRKLSSYNPESLNQQSTVESDQGVKKHQDTSKNHVLDNYSDIVKQQDLVSQEQLIKQQELQKQQQISEKQEAVKKQEILLQKQQQQEIINQKLIAKQLNDSQQQQFLTVNSQDQSIDHSQGDSKDGGKKKRIRNKKTNKVENQKIEPYNPKHLPLYLGIYVYSNKLAEERAINNWIKDCLDFADSKYSKDADFSRMRSQWLSSVNGAGSFYEMSKPSHVQTLFIGGHGEDVRQQPSFRDFQPELNISINLTFLIASPDNLLTALISPTTIPNQNPYPNMTLYTAKLKSKDSNELIAQSLAIDQQSKLAVRAKQHPQTDLANKVVMNFRGRDTQVYIICIDKCLKMDGITRAFEK